MSTIKITSGGKEFKITSTSYSVTINNVPYRKPGKGDSITVVGGTVYFNGYVLRNKKFRLSLVGLFYKWFN